MEVNNNASLLKADIQTEIIKKSQDTQVNLIKDILEKNLDTKSIQTEAAKFTGSGNNLDIKA